MKKRTIVYIDGFNLYYGSLKNSPYKWLDLKLVFEKLLGDYHSLVEIKYFTAKISQQKINDNAPKRQSTYLYALQKHIPELKIYYGHYLQSKIKAKLCNPLQNSSSYVEVYKTEEKGSDVNIALHILNDAWLDKYDCAVLVSNDSDIAEALRFVKSDHQKEIGLVVPGDEKNRKVSKQLQRYAHFIKRLRNSVLADSQLPNPIVNTKIYKPQTW